MTLWDSTDNYYISMPLWDSTDNYYIMILWLINIIFYKILLIIIILYKYDYL